MRSFMICAAHQIVWVINLTKIRGRACGTYWGDGNTCRKLVGKSEGNSHLEDLTVDGKFMSNWILNNTDRMSVDWIHLVQGKKIAGFCEHGNDHSASTKCGEFPDQLRNYYRLITPDRSAPFN
jgi:hypothetical protein